MLMRMADDIRRERANQAARGDYVHAVPTPGKTKGYRPRR
jgi:hypothetical protein